MNNWTNCSSSQPVAEGYFFERISCSKEPERNNNFLIIFIVGQEEECKRKWNGIRDSLRRARQKRKTKSKQAATSTFKYKYEALLEFLIPHLTERKGLTNVPDEEDDDDDPSETGNKL
jgi:hypothetical protein